MFVDNLNTFGICANKYTYVHTTFDFIYKSSYHSIYSGLSLIRPQNTRKNLAQLNGGPINETI